MQAGVVQIKLMADILDLQSKMQQAEKMVSGAANNIRSTMTGLAGAFVAGLGINVFKGLITGTIEAQAHLNDTAIIAGTTVEALTALSSVGKFSDMGADEIAASMNKLTTQMAKATEESAGAGVAIGKLGLDFDTFAAMKPDEQMVAVAKALEGFSDGAGKSAVMMALYGEQGAKMLPFMKDLGVAGELSAKVTTEQAAAADNLSDNLTRLRGTQDAWKKELVNGMIPALDDSVQAFLGVYNSTGGVRDQVRKLAADGSIRDWTTAAVTGISYVVDVGQGLLSLIPMIGKMLAGMAASASASFGAIHAAFGKLTAGDLSGAWDTLKTGASTVKTIASEAAADVRSIWNQPLIGQKFRENLAGLKSAGEQAKAVKKDLDMNGLLAGKDGQKQAIDQQAAAYAELINSIKSKIAADKQSLEYGEKLTESQKIQIKIEELVANGKIKLSDATSAQTKAAIAALSAAEDALATHKAEVEWLNAARDARLKLAGAQEQSAAEAEKQNKTLRDEIELIGLSESAQTAILQSRQAAIILTKEAALAELERQAAITGTMTREQIALAAEIDSLKERNGLLSQKQVAEEAFKSWTAVWGNVDTTARDVFNSIFDGGSNTFKKLGQVLKSSLLDLLYKMTVQPFIIQIGTSLLGTGFASAASAATSQAGGSAIGSLLGSAGTSALGSFGSTLTGITASLGQFGTAALASTQSLIGLTGTAAQASTAATMGAAAQTGASTFATTAGTAIPYVAAAVAVASALGLFRSTKTVGSGIMGTVGETNNVNSYDLNRKSGFLFGGPDYSLASKGLDAATSKTINDAINSISAGSKAYAQALGLGTDALKGFTTTLGSDLIHPDTGGIGIDLTGLTADQAVAKINTELAKVGDAYAQRLIGTFAEVTTSFERQIQEWVSLGGDNGFGWVSRTESGTSTTSTYTPSEFAKDGETASQTLARLASSLVTVNNLFTGMGSTLMATSLAGANMASQLLDAFGGSDNATKALGSYYGNFYSEAERTANTTRLLTSTLATLGLTLPTTREGFRSLVDAQDLTTESGRAAYATLVAASDAFAGIVPASVAAADAAATVTEAVNTTSTAISTTLASALESLRNPIRTVEDVAKSLFDLEQNSSSLRIELMRAQGNTTGADAAQRGLDTSGYTAAELAVYDYNTALRAQISAVTAAAQAAQDAAAAEAATASQRAGLEQQIMQAMGDTTGLRALELAALDPSNRALQERLYALQDEAAATAAASAAQQLADQAAAATASQRAGLEQQLMQAMGDTAGLRALELAALDPSNRALQERLYALQDQAATTAAASAAQQQADQAAATIASQRAGLEQQLLQAQGDTASLRFLELLALDPTNRALQQRLYDLQDEAAATAAASAAQQLADQAAAATASQRAGLEQQLMQAMGDTAGLRARELAALDPANRALQERLYDLQDEAAATAAASAAQQLADQAAAATASQRAGLEQQIMQAMGDTTGLRALELAALDPSNRALQERLYALQDEAAATAAASAAQQQADQAAATIASQRAGLEQQLLQAQGDTASLRFLELLALDPTNRALQERIYALQDEAAATAAASAAQQLADQAAAATASQRAGLEQQLMQALGDTAGLRARELAALDPTNRALQERIYDLQDEAAATAAASAAQQLADQAAAATASQRAGLEQQLMQALGDTAGLRARELAALDPTNRALQQRLYDLQDEAAATAAANTAAQAAADAQKQLAEAQAAAAAAIANEYGGLWRQWLTATGDTAALRALDLAALNPANRALQEQIWAYQDQKAAADAATSSTSSLTSAWASLTDSITAEVRRIRGLIDESSGSSYASLQAQFAVATAQARAGDQAAAGQLAGLSQDLLTAATASATTLLDLQRIRAMTANSLEQTAGMLGQSGTSAAAGAPSALGQADYSTGAAPSVAAPASSSSLYADLTAELRAEISALRGELSGLRADGQAQGSAIAANTRKTAQLLEKFDNVGMPVTNTPDAVPLTTTTV